MQFLDTIGNKCCVFQSYEESYNCLCSFTFLTIQSCHDNSLIKYIVDNILKLLVGRDGHEEKAKPVEVAFGGGGIFWPIIKCSEFLV